MKDILFTGSGVAIVTPFHAGVVNFPAFGRLIDRQIDGGTDAIIVCGTTGEAATMTQKERMETIAYCVDRVAGRVPVEFFGRTGGVIPTPDEVLAAIVALNEKVGE